MMPTPCPLPGGGDTFSEGYAPVGLALRLPEHEGGLFA